MPFMNGADGGGGGGKKGGSTGDGERWTSVRLSAPPQSRQGHPREKHESKSKKEKKKEIKTSKLGEPRFAYGENG